MQPDLLSPEKEESQLGSSSAQETQVETQPLQEAKNVSPSPAGKKRSKSIWAYLALGVLVFLLLAAFAWVGYWAYNLSTQLVHSQQQLVTLQASFAELQTGYETLKSENGKLNTELVQTRSDLEQASSDLDAAQSDLAASQSQSKSLSDQIDRASKLADILYAFDTVKNEIDFLQLDKLIRDSKNQQVITEWNNISSDEDFRNFLGYLILVTRDSLK
jgi:septal ring factor EnvC (AmiA/AmiB activator)